jgi:hypothetical protein
MSHKRGGLLAQIEADVVDDKVSLSSLLQKCIVLGGEAGSEKMRAWARRELNGYARADTVPDYRHVPAAVVARITNSAGYNGRSVRFDDSVFPQQIRDIIREKVDLEDAILGEGIGELEAMATQGKDEHTLIPSWATFIAQTLNQHNMEPGSRVADVYWSVSNASIRGILVRIRTALAELVAELITLTPQDQEVPDKLAADQAVQFVITGDRATIHYSSQHAADGSMNVAVSGGSAPGPVTVSGAHGSAVGTQTASGTNSSVVSSQAANGADSTVVGGQAVQAGHDAVSVGQGATMTSAEDQHVKEGWWARLRKRGVVVAFAIILRHDLARDVVDRALGVVHDVAGPPGELHLNGPHEPTPLRLRPPIGFRDLPIQQLIALVVPYGLLGHPVPQVAELQQREPGGHSRPGRQQPRRDIAPGGRQMPRLAIEHHRDQEADHRGGDGQHPAVAGLEQRFRLLAFLVHGRKTTGGCRLLRAGAGWSAGGAAAKSWVRAGSFAGFAVMGVILAVAQRRRLSVPMSGLTPLSSRCPAGPGLAGHHTRSAHLPYMVAALPPSGSRATVSHLYTRRSRPSLIRFIACAVAWAPRGRRARPRTRLPGRPGWRRRC